MLELGVRFLLGEANYLEVNGHGLSCRRPRFSDSHSPIESMRGNSDQSCLTTLAFRRDVCKVALA
jgi:hypothetical protein